jgi:O-antigen ligase
LLFRLLCGSVIVSAICLGGGTHKGFLGDAAVQLASIPLLVFGLWRVSGGRGVLWHGARMPLAILITFLFATIIQSLDWGAAANRLGALSAMKLPATGIVVADPWAKLSLTPQATWAAATSIIPAVAVFLSVGLLSMKARLDLCAVIVFLGFLSLLLGLLQVAQGPSSQLRFFEYTNPTEAVGFFANRNHFATLLCITLLLTSPWLVSATRGALQKSALRTTNILFFVAACAMIIAITTGLALARSRAGMLLAMAALAGIFAISVSVSERGPIKPTGLRSPKRIVFALLVFSAFFAAQLGLHRVLVRFERDPLEDLRVAYATVSWDAAWVSLPFGTGLGSFVSAYAVFERSTDLLTVYANRAHNDFLEFFLEFGLLGILVKVLFLVWFATRCFEVWRRPQQTGMTGIILQRAATVCVALVLLHSLVDYPLRTTAVAVVFAYCCGVLLPFKANPITNTEQRGDRVAPVAEPVNIRPTAGNESQPVDEILGVEWPEQWKN